MSSPEPTAVLLSLVLGLLFVREAVWDLVAQFQHVKVRLAPRCQYAMCSVADGGRPQIPLCGIQEVLELATA